MSKYILTFTFLFLVSQSIAMEEAKALRDLSRSSLDRDFYYPGVAAAKTEHGKEIANKYFKEKMPKILIAGIISFANAHHYLKFGGNLQEAHLVVPALKEFNNEVMALAFELRDPNLAHDKIGDEFEKAALEINKRAQANKEKWERIKALVDNFNATFVNAGSVVFGHE